MGLAFGGQGGLRLFRRGHLLAELSQARLAGRRICRGAQQQQCQVEAGKAVSHTADTDSENALPPVTNRGAAIKTFDEG
jgi:hypothetical protein